MPGVGWTHSGRTLPDGWPAQRRNARPGGRRPSTCRSVRRRTSGCRRQPARHRSTAYRPRLRCRTARRGWARRRTREIGGGALEVGAVAVGAVGGRGPVAVLLLRGEVGSDGVGPTGSARGTGPGSGATPGPNSAPPSPVSSAPVNSALAEWSSTTRCSPNPSLRWPARSGDPGGATVRPDTVRPVASPVSGSARLRLSAAGRRTVHTVVHSCERRVEQVGYRLRGVGPLV